jgi:hypothetical protein
MEEGSNGEESERVSPAPPIRKTAEDENDSEMTLNPGIASLRMLFLLGKKSQNGSSKYSLKLVAK